MRRRGLTVLLGAVLTVFLGVLIGVAEVPYVTLSPGPTIDTLGAVDVNGEVCTDPAPPAPPPAASPAPSASPAGPEAVCQQVIQIIGAPTSTGKGQLRMVTVSVQSNMTLLEAIRGWFSDEDAVVPRELIYPEDKSEQEVEQENRQEFEDSQTSAETAALTRLGYPIQISVDQVTPDGAAAGVLMPGDIIESVDGTAVTSGPKLLELIRAKPAGSTLAIGYYRGSAKSTANLTTKPADDGSPRIGVSISNVQPHPFQMHIKLDKVGGPSAGMMFALGIIDKIKPEDLTNGFVVAGTGTIDDEGNVGPIGGVVQKLYGARAAGATVFLVPEANCAETQGQVPSGLRLVRVSTLDDALAALAALPGGGPLPTC